MVREDALEYWHALAPTLIGSGLLTAIDVFTFARYCNLLARYAELDAMLMTRGAMGTTYPVRDAKGKVRGTAELPQAWEYRHVLSQLLAHEREFGLTPSSRSTIRLAPRGL